MLTLAQVKEKLEPFVGQPRSCPVEANKGIAGILMEKLAGIPQTSNIVDCHDGEVKSFPLKTLKGGAVVPKETVAVTMVQLESLDLPFAESNVYKKLARTLYLPLSRDGDNIILQKVVLHTLEPDTPLYKQLEDDYNAICSAYKATGTLSGTTGLGKYLQTRTKGAGHGTTSRAFYLRTSFLKEYIL
jgi:DNA mismatch repair protein MutH